MIFYMEACNCAFSIYFVALKFPELQPIQICQNLEGELLPSHSKTFSLKFFISTGDQTQSYCQIRLFLLRKKGMNLFLSIWEEKILIL